MASTDKFNNIRVAFRGYLKDDADITTSVAARIFPSELAEIQNPKYPLITFRVSGGIPLSGLNVAEVVKYNIEIKAFSKVSYDEAFRIYGDIRKRLIGSIIRRLDVNMVPKEVSSASTFYDGQAQTYAVRGIFSIKALW